MWRHRPGLLLLAAMLALVLLASSNVLAAGNLVALSSAGDEIMPVSRSDLAPPECAGMTLTMIGWMPSPGSYYNPYSNMLVLGTPGDDTLDNRSTTSETCVVMGDGDDRVDNYGRNAVVLGGNGADVLNGSGYIDHMYGGADNDSLYGNGDADLLDGGAGDDTVYGGDGNDTVYGGAGDDRLFGEKGRDTLNGGPDVDYCEGGQGTDSFVQCETQMP